MVDGDDDDNGDDVDDELVVIVTANLADDVILDVDGIVVAFVVDGRGRGRNLGRWILIIG